VNATIPPGVLRVVDAGCGAACVETATAEALHRDCFCVAVDPLAVKEQLHSLLDATGTPVHLADAHAHLFSSLPIFVPEPTVALMTAAVKALTEVVALPAYVAAALSWAPAIATRDPGSPGGLLGFDFHLGPDGPRLIEINTNPGGLLLNAVLARAQRLCLPELSKPAVMADAEEAAITALLEEWRLQGGLDSDALIAIVDESPEQQYLYAEFLLFRQALKVRGYRAAICAPDNLLYVDGELRLGAQRIGFVYNRLTDFALESPSLRALRQAYLDGNVALSPHPRAHALWADKRNLTLLCQPAFLVRSGLESVQRALIATIVPQTNLLTADNREDLWATRRQWFFKPAAGFGSRASYRGDKLTHKTWEQMASQPYVAQAIVAPSQRHTTPDAEPLKVDLRCYAYQGKALLFAARLYQGQTTNFRTPGGGFAPVLTLAQN
jgi:hypothetical protein